MIEIGAAFQFEREGGKIDVIIRHSPSTLPSSFIASINGFKSEDRSIEEAIKGVRAKIEQARITHQTKLLRKIT